MALPCSTSASRLPHSGRNCRSPHLQTSAIRTWPDDLLLHPDQPLPDLPAALSPSLSRWLAGKRYPGRHALWTCFRTSTGCLLPAPRSRRRPVSRVVSLPEPRLALHPWRHLGPDATARHPAARSLLPGRSHPHPPTTPEPADQIRAAGFG